MGTVFWGKSEITEVYDGHVGDIDVVEMVGLVRNRNTSVGSTG